MPFDKLQAFDQTASIKPQTHDGKNVCSVKNIIQDAGGKCKVGRQYLRGEVVVFLRILLYNDAGATNDCALVGRTGLKADRKEEVYGLFIT